MAVYRIELGNVLSLEVCRTLTKGPSFHQSYGKYVAGRLTHFLYSSTMSSPRNQKNILILSPDQAFKLPAKDALIPRGYHVFEAKTSGEALSILEREPVDILFIDLEASSAQEFDLVSYARMRLPRTEVIVLATVNRLDDATKAIRNGASLYLIKPIQAGDLQALLDKVSLRLDEREEHFEMEQRILADLMAGSPSMQKVLKLAIKIAPTASTVLLGGESGTGKEFFARIIHRASRRLDGEFVAMNCGAIPDTLFESELFGYRKGAFTGADRDKPGLVEEAHMGTLFLDEVGELSPSSQVKLLRFLQERTFRRIGDNSLRSVNVRIIAATNKDLASMVRQGRFREDLYYRLNVFFLYLPPLRERKETIPNLIRIFVHRYNELFGKNILKFSKAAEVILANYDYPGNVRELENILEHAIVLADGEEIREKDLPEVVFRNRLLLPSPGKEDGNGREIIPLQDVEKQHIARALELLENNYTEAAKRLGISRSTLWRKIKDYGLEPV